MEAAKATKALTHLPPPLLVAGPLKKELFVASLNCYSYDQGVGAPEPPYLVRHRNICLRLWLYTE